MPGKSRHGRGKHSSRRSKTIMRQATAPPEAHSGAVTPEVPRSAVTAAPAPRATAASARTSVVTYPFIASELRRIAVVAGIVIVILVVLAIFLA